MGDRNMNENPTEAVSQESKVSLFGMTIDPLRLDGAAERVLQWATDDS